MPAEGRARVESPTTDVAVIGGGIIGLMIARELVRSGRHVTLIDPAPFSGATSVAAGMLADIDEFHFQESALAEFTVAARGMWDEIFTQYGASELGVTTGILTVGVDRDDRDTIARLRGAFHSAQGSDGSEDRLLTLREAQEREPQLSRRISGAFFSPTGAALDPAALSELLWSELQENSRFSHRPLAVSGLAVSHGPGSDGMGIRLNEAAEPARVLGAECENGETIFAQETIIANAVGAAALANLPAPLPLRAVYGDILRLIPAIPSELPRHTLRALVGGRSVYLVPRRDHMVLGATVREDGRPGVSAEGVHQLLHDAHLVYPAIFNASILRQESGARPGTPDNLPLLGRFLEDEGTEIPGCVVATGFFRHGVLLAPLAARAVADILDAPKTPERWRALAPDRFHSRHGQIARKVSI